MKLLFETIIIPQKVYDELCEIPHQKYVIDQSEWIVVKSVKNQNLVLELENDLDSGEAQAIALAIETPATYLLIDEIKGRNIAERMGIKIVGLIGIIIKAKEKQLIPTVRPIIEDLTKVGFRISPHLVKHIFTITNEL